jgi:hypothetical protein
MKALGRVSVPVSATTLLSPSVRQGIPFTEALLNIKNIVYFHHMPQYCYHTEASFKCMEDYLKKFHCHKDDLSPFRASKSTKIVSEALNKQFLFPTHEELQSDSA